MDGHKNPDDSHNYHDEIRDEIESCKEIVTWAPYDTQHQNNAHPETSPIDWWGAADQCSMSHGTHIHIMI